MYFFFLSKYQNIQKISCSTYIVFVYFYVIKSSSISATSKMTRWHGYCPRTHHAIQMGVAPASVQKQDKACDHNACLYQEIGTKTKNKAVKLTNVPAVMWCTSWIVYHYEYCSCFNSTHIHPSFNPPTQTK